MVNKYLSRHTNLNSTKEAWELSWSKQKLHVADIIDLGRKVYNYFLFRFLRKYINSQTEFLEFGCGTATLGVMLAKKIKSYTGFDIADNALEKAAENFKKSGLQNFNFEVKDITNFNSDKKFDIVWSQGLIEHFNEPYKLIDSHLEVCKGGGRVIISVPASRSYHHLWYFLTRPIPLRRFWPWPDAIFIYKKMVDQYMKILANSYSQYHVTYIKPRILGLLVIIINR